MSIFINKVETYINSLLKYLFYIQVEQKSKHVLIYIYMNDQFTNNHTFYFNIDFQYLRSFLFELNVKHRLKFAIISIREENSTIRFAFLRKEK